MRKKEILLTPEELEEIKDNEGFKVKTILLLKQLNGIPIKVTRLEVHSAIHWVLLMLIISGVLGLSWKVFGQLTRMVAR